MKQLLSDRLELIATSGKQKGTSFEQHDSMLQEDELAILADYERNKGTSQGKAAKDVILEYDEYEK